MTAQWAGSPSQAWGSGDMMQGRGPRGEEVCQLYWSLVLRNVWAQAPEEGRGTVPSLLVEGVCRAGGQRGQQSNVLGQEAQIPRGPSMGPRSPDARCAGRGRGLLVLLETS